MITVDGEKREWNENMTVSNLLDTMEGVDFCSVIRLNGRLISSPKFDETLIPDNAEIQLLPIVAGG